MWSVEAGEKEQERGLGSLNDDDVKHTHTHTHTHTHGCFLFISNHPVDADLMLPVNVC